MRDSFWRIDGGPTASFAPIPIDGHAGPETTITPGTAYDLDAWLTGKSDSQTGAWPGNIERYKQLLQYGNRAGQFALSRTMGGGVRFVETHDGEIPGGSLLIALRPPVDCPLAHGGWYLIESVEDATMLDRLGELIFELVHLTTLDEYRDASGQPDFAACRDALEREGI